MDIAIREQLDAGKPIINNKKYEKISKIYNEIAIKTSLKIASLNEDINSKFPKIVIEKN